jgi:predicted heme/steroid binding protein
MKISVTAVMWFGTIFYTHLVLKPAYAASGVILAHFRIHSLQILFHTRFGILLMVKVALFLLMVSSALVAVLVVGPALKRRKRPSPPAAAARELSPEELEWFDGKEGRPAYIGYEGEIFDVTSSTQLWARGEHFNAHRAGSDLTDALKQAPHGPEKVRARPVAGHLVPAGVPESCPGHERVFYVLAYLNFALALSILLVIALWRWW